MATSQKQTVITYFHK